MTAKIAINGFGRIGRNVLRALAEGGREDVQVVALNDLLDEVEKFRKVGSRLQAFSIRNAPGGLAQDALGEAVA